jgi:hypothetical protein
MYALLFHTTSFDEKPYFNLRKATSNALNSNDPLNHFLVCTIHAQKAAPVPAPLIIPDLSGEDTAAFIFVPEDKLGEGVLRTIDHAAAETAAVGASAGGPTSSGWLAAKEYQKEMKVQYEGRWVMVESVGKWNARFG